MIANPLTLPRYSIGIGDRFGMEGRAQLRALKQALDKGVEVIPVWNKSNREHTIIGTRPEDARKAADDAVKAMDWKGKYYLDADHISLITVDPFITHCDFFTLDVADFIRTTPDPLELEVFEREMKPLCGLLRIPTMNREIRVSEEMIRTIGSKYLCAVKEAGRIYRYIQNRKENAEIIVEISMDETNLPQTPVELFFILAAAAQEKIPIQTIAPKFSGMFLKGIDYIGDRSDFAKEFEEDIIVVSHAISVFSLPSSLKLSVHSGSDKFSLYPLMYQAMKKHNAGLHLKTAGTTWLEEVIGLAAAGNEGLRIAKEIYKSAYMRIDELCAPYATVVQIERTNLPSPEQVEQWTSNQFVSTLRHDQHCPTYNKDIRQMIHVAFKVAAEMGDRYRNALETHEKIIGKCVTDNLLERHIKPLFLGEHSV
ncbi:MAG: tagaturonate epimerase family protein [bacterium]